MSRRPKLANLGLWRLVSALACVAAGGARSAHAEETEVSFAYVPAPGAETLTVEQLLGRLTIRGWDNPQVRIVANKHAPDSASLDRLRVSVEVHDGQIHVKTGVRVGDALRALPLVGRPAAPSGSNPNEHWAGNVDLTIDAPRQVALHATTWAGDLSASGFRAGAELGSVGGEVRASDIDGPVRCTSVRGGQRLSGIRGNVDAEGLRGVVELDAIEGALLHASVVEGQITARRIQAQLVQLFSGDGGIVLVGRLRPGARYELAAEIGDVHLLLEPTPFSLVARTPGGEVKSQFPLEGRRQGPGWLRAEFQGGGALIDAQLGAGSLILDHP